jgi:hypothetical protein
VALSDFVHGRPRAKWYTLQYYDPIKGSVPAGQILLVIHLAEKGTLNSIKILTYKNFLNANYAATSSQFIYIALQNRKLIFVI